MKIFTKSVLIAGFFVVCGAMQAMAVQAENGHRGNRSDRKERTLHTTKTSLAVNDRTADIPSNVINRGNNVSDSRVRGIAKNNANIYAWSQWPGTETIRKGLYRLDGDEGISLVWQDAYYYEIEGMTLRNGYYKDGKVIGLAVDEAMGMVFDMSRVVYDLETGEVEDDIFMYDNIYMDRMAYDPVHNVVYATSNEKAGEVKWLKVSESDWSEYEEIGLLDSGVSSLCYNAAEDACFGIDHNKNFVRIETDGYKSVIAKIDFDFSPGLIGSIVYSPAEDIYYANIATNDSSYLMTISPTGEWDVYYELPGNNQLCFMFTTDTTSIVNSQRPAKPEMVDFAFLPGVTDGTITYKLPSERMDGTPLSGSMTAVALLDGEEYKTYSVEAGDNLEVSFKGLESGTHYFGLYVKYDELISQTLLMAEYIGHDVPLDPKDVILEPGFVSWSPVIGGVHNGYVDLDALYYKVVINGKQYGETSENSLAIELPDEELTVYTASVTAIANGMVSAPGKSNSLVHGHPFELPMTIKPTADQAKLVTIIDGNEDGYYWYYDNEYDSFCCDYSDYGIENDDWLIMPPFMVTSDVKECNLNFLVGNLNSYYPDELLEVYLGTMDKDGSISMTQEIVAPFTPNMFVIDGHQKVESDFKIPTGGTYYIGFHWISEPEQAGMEVKSICVTAKLPSGLESLSTCNEVTGKRGGISIKGYNGNVICVYTFDGKMVKNCRITADNTFITLEKGLYIVAVDGVNTKVIVK